MQTKIKKANKYPYDLRTLLKVKIKSLAEEARIIRLEERRTDSLPLYQMLSDHRRRDIRYEARHALLAYGYLRGTPLHKIERSETPADWDRVRRLVVKYGPTDDSERSRVTEQLASWSSGMAIA